jgi:hypothetical protein
VTQPGILESIADDGAAVGLIGNGVPASELATGS